MKSIVENIIDKYSLLFPNDDISVFKNFITNSSDTEIYDWNNFNGHIVASAFVYAKRENKFLVLYHRDLGEYLYPGGHVDSTDLNPLEAAKRETIEETGINKFDVYKFTNDELIPLEIDTHYIKRNERLNLPMHPHFDFRYLFFVDHIGEVVIDLDESRDFKWVDIDELSVLVKSGNIVNRIRDLDI